MRIVVIPDNLSREEFLARVQAELDAMGRGSRALVLLDDKTLPYEGKTVQTEMYTIDCMRIKQTMPSCLYGATADIVAVEKANRITKRCVTTLLITLNDHADDHGVLICPAELEAML